MPTARWKTSSACPFPRLYRGPDVLHARKDRLCRHLLERYQSWFGVEFEFLLYDVTSTDLEGKAEANAKAARGYSRDQRSDCKQVNIGLVCTPEVPSHRLRSLRRELLRAASRRSPLRGSLRLATSSLGSADVRTVEDMVTMMEKKYGQAKRIWVMDRGMVSEDNLDFLCQRQACYIVSTPKQHLRRFEAQLLGTSNWTEVQPGVEFKLATHPDGRGGEQYVLCRSRVFPH